MAEQIRADPEKTCTVEINERTTKKQAKSLPGSERGSIGHRERRGRKRSLSQVGEPDFGSVRLVKPRAIPPRPRTLDPYLGLGRWLTPGLRHDSNLLGNPLALLLKSGD